MSDDDELPPEDEGGGDAWLVSYADLMTLLFAAFVVLYGIKPEGRSMEILGVVSRIREAFVDIPDVIPEEQAKGPIKNGIFAFKFFKGDQMNKPIIKKFRRNTNVTNVINVEFNQAKELMRMLKVIPDKQESSKGHKRALEVDEQGFTMRLFGTYFYERGKYRLKRDSLAKVRQIGLFLKDLDRTIVIEGHTDSEPFGRYDNWEISALRATYIAKFFSNEVGFPPDRIKVSGYADKKPIADNKTESGRKVNRRVEIKVEYGD